MKKHVIERLIHLLMIIFIYSSIIIAQDNKMISGKIIDVEGFPLAFVNVFILNSFDGAIELENQDVFYSQPIRKEQLPWLQV